jgi:hypothetical protein
MLPKIVAEIGVSATESGMEVARLQEIGPVQRSSDDERCG